MESPKIRYTFKYVTSDIRKIKEYATDPGKDTSRPTLINVKLYA